MCPILVSFVDVYVCVCVCTPKHYSPTLLSDSLPPTLPFVLPPALSFPPSCLTFIHTEQQRSYCSYFLTCTDIRYNTQAYYAEQERLQQAQKRLQHKDAANEFGNMGYFAAIPNSRTLSAPARC